MTSRVYAIDPKDREPPLPPAAPAPRPTREERTSYRESVSGHREQVRNFCDSLAAELTGTDRPPLRSYLHTADDGTKQLRVSVFENGTDAAAALEKAGAEFLYTEDPEPSVERQILRIPATFQHQTVGQGLTPEQVRRDGEARNRLAGAIRRQAPDVPAEAAQRVRWMTAARDETNGYLADHMGPKPEAPAGRPRRWPRPPGPDRGRAYHPAGAVTSGHACTGRGLRLRQWGQGGRNLQARAGQ